MGNENSAITRVWPILHELLCTGRGSKESLHTVFDLAFRKHHRRLAQVLRDRADQVVPGLLDKPPASREIYGTRLRLPGCFEYSIPAPERFLRWLIEHAGQECAPRKGLPAAQRDAGRRHELFGTNESAKRSARAEAIEHLLLNSSEGSRREWWAFEGETSVDCFLETPSMVLLIEGKRTEPISPGTDWFEKRNQIARNLEAAQTVARGRRYAVLLVAEQEIEVRLPEIAAGLPHMSDPEQAFLTDHYLGCITWKELSEAADLPIDFAALSDVKSSERWLRDRGMGD